MTTPSAGTTGTSPSPSPVHVSTGANSSGPSSQPPAGDPPSGQQNPPSEPSKPQGDPAGPTPEDVQRLQQALERERSLRKDAEKKAKEASAAEAKLAELETAAQSETERAVAAARKETAAEVLAAANWRLVNAEARALAAEQGFRNPLLTVKTLDLADITVTDDGVVDVDTLKARLDELAKDAPYLLADDGKPRTPKPDPSQGSGRAPALTGAEKGLAEAERRFGKRNTT